MFEGIITALISPFKEDLIDWNSLEKLIEVQKKQKVDGLVLNGTTSESPCLSSKEKKEIFHFVKKRISVPLILGTGTNYTKSSIENTKEAKDLKADGALVVLPYYNKPQDEGMIQHFKSISQSVSGFPLIAYNVPSRTSSSLNEKILNSFKKITEIKAIKEASDSFDLLEKFKDDFTFLSGDDLTCLEFCEKGGKGVISVISHLIADELKYLMKNNLKLEYQKNWKDLLEAIYKEVNPAGIKQALKELQIIESSELRSPLMSFSSKNTEALKTVLSKKEFLI